MSLVPAMCHNSEMARTGIHQVQRDLPCAFRAALLPVIIGVFFGMSAAKAAEAWVINPARTRILFEVSAAGYGLTKGEFKAFDGKLSIDFDRPARSRVSFSVSSASVELGSRGINAYVRSEVLFDADKHPRMTFVSSTIEKLDAGTALVNGGLTMLGVTRPAQFRVTVERRASGKKEIAGFTARGKVRRSEFGMDSGIPLVANEVSITVTTEAEGQ